MKLGKVSDNTLKRSVLKQIKTKRSEVTKGAGIGEDCAFFAFGQDAFAGTIQTLTVTEADDAERLLHRCVNNLACAGAEPVGVFVSLTLPKEAEEAELKAYMRTLEKGAAELQIQICGGHTTVSESVKETAATLCCFGKARADRCGQEKSAGKKTGKAAIPGMDIVVTKWIGLEGTAILAKRYEQELRKRYPEHMIETAQAFRRYMSVVPEAAVAWKSGAEAMHDVSEGGILAALWELAEGAGVGLNIQLRKLPIRQETVEVCELLERNPYELLGGGSLLIVTADGEQMVAALQEAGIPATVVGRTTDGNERLILNEDEKRYMDRPAVDAVIKK